MQYRELTVCIKLHVGQTSNALMERSRVHKQQVLHPDIAKCPASKHIDRCAFYLCIPNKLMPFLQNKFPKILYYGSLSQSIQINSIVLNAFIIGNQYISLQCIIVVVVC